MPSAILYFILIPMHIAIYLPEIVSTTDISRILFAGPYTANTKEHPITSKIMHNGTTGKRQTVPHLNVTSLSKKNQFKGSPAAQPASIPKIP